LPELLTEDAPTWLFAGQAHIQGEMSQALLLQLLALNEQLPLPSRLPPENELITLLTTLQAAQQAGSIPLQVLSLSENKELYDRLRTGQADLIQSNSGQYMKNEQESQSIIFAPLPTLTESDVTVIDGYLFAVTTDQARQQEAAARYLNWLLESSRWAEWSEAIGGLPARRSALPQAIRDEAYQNFLDERLEHGWIRPGGALFRDFAQIMQEQFRGVMLEQISPTEAVETITETYAP
jgi:ABC-type glycerol-3-phosphate transport system substrate-binding protein